MEILSRFDVGRDPHKGKGGNAAFPEIRGKAEYGGYRNRWSRIFYGGKIE